MASFGARKARVHGTGATNRGTGWRGNEGPRDFDNTMRSTLPRNITFKNDKQVPICPDGEPNLDFSPKLSGHTYRMPNSDPALTKETKRREKEATARAAADAAAAAVPTIHATEDQATRAPKNRGHKAAPRWNPDKWFQKPHYDQPPLQKEQGETWNSLESDKIQGEIKGQDRLMRTVRRPEDVATPLSDAGGNHPLNYDREEYYPGRSLIDVKLEDPGNDFQVRPTHLPDMFNPPAAGADPVARAQRLREMLKQRYAGRPGLLGVFKQVAKGRNGYLYHEDLVNLLDGMGCKVSEEETKMLLGSVDKDQKGAVNFEEFCDLIYGQNVKIGGKIHEVQERYVRHITKNLMDSLITNGQVLGKVFCEIDPERNYMISKKQFANAIGSSANHVSQQAIDFLWASQFPSMESHDADREVLDWRGFMAQLGHFAHANRRPTPCFLQGRKRQYDLLQRTAAITGGVLPDVDTAGQQDDADDLVLVGDKLRHRKNQLQCKPREVANLTEHYAEVLRSKAERTEHALPKRVTKARLQRLLKERKVVHQDELTALLVKELEQPESQPPLEAKAPLYAQPRGPPDVLTLDAEGLAAAGAASPPRGGTAASGASGQAGAGPGVGHNPAFLKLVRGDVEAYVASQKTDRDHQVNVAEFLENLYKPEYERRAIDKVNDGYNRALRKHCPERERPPDSEVPRYENYWQARVMMEALGDAVAAKESSNGGNLKPSKLFKRLDVDNDGWISLSDMRSALDKYKVPHTTADLHALFSQLDADDSGAVNIGVFTRNYETSGGNMMDSMAKPVKGVLHEGGVQYGGPVQDAIDEKERTLQERADHQMARLQAADGASARAPERSESAPPATGSDRSRRSQISRTGANILAVPSTPMIYETQVAQMTGSCRVSDAIRSRFSAWKAQKSELYTSLPKARYGLTDYHDTRHITEPSVPLSGQYMPDSERFKTTNHVMSAFSVPDHAHPQTSDDLRKHSLREYKVERIRDRQRDFSERCWAANEAAQNFDDRKMAHKALTLMNYERQTRMACN